MVPVELKDFLIATVTASASFIGLLFVAMTFTMDKANKDKKQVALEYVLAESSYVALLNVFFVSLVALIPSTNIGYVTLVMAILGLSNSFRLTRSHIKDGVGKTILGLTTLIYGFEAAYGAYMLANDHHTLGRYTLMTIILFLFGSALGRAWELTGIHRD